MTSSEYKEHLRSFIKEIDEERFYDAHESLEKIWFPRRFENSDEIRLLKGFINASVSFELAKKGKAEASAKVWKTYIKYIALIDAIESPHMDEYRLMAQHVNYVRIFFGF